jgi:hypothetical protein
MSFTIEGAPQTVVDAHPPILVVLTSHDLK